MEQNGFSVNEKKTLKTDGDNPSERIYFPELDGLRFFAFLLVFIYHHILFSTIPCLSFLFINGWIGVDLFFVLSSFLFTKLLIAEYKKNNTISFKKFYIRRIFRIWPIYFLSIVFSLSYIFLQHQEISKYIGIRIIGMFTFSDNILSSIYGFNPMFSVSHLWTISYEEQFYICIPIIILLLVRSSTKTKVLSLMLTLIVFNTIKFMLIANHITKLAILMLPITRFESIIFGIVMGFGGMDILLKKINQNILSVMSILFFVLICHIPRYDNISYWLIVSPLVGMSTSLLTYSVLNTSFFKKVFTHKVLAFLGKRSYGLYVYHLFCNALANYMIKSIPTIPSSPLASFFYSLSFTILASIVSYKIIETPFLNWKKKFEVVTSRPI